MRLAQFSFPRLMISILAMTLLLGLLGPQALCAQLTAEEYFNRGLKKQEAGDHEGAMLDYNKAIELDPKGVVGVYGVGAYVNRANYKKLKGDHQGAMVDYDKAVELQPRIWIPVNNRAMLKDQLGDREGALADFSKAIRINPSLAMAYDFRGNLRFRGGDLKGALEDYRKRSQLEPKTADYPQIKTWLVRARQGEKAAANVELSLYLESRRPAQPTDWPLSIAHFLLGTTSEADFLASASSTDRTVDREQKCEAYYYAGSKRLVSGEKEKAEELFRRCLATEVTNFVEYVFARDELKLSGK